MALNPPAPGPRDWDGAPLTRQVRASAGLRHDHLARVARQAPAAEVTAEADAVARYLARFAQASAAGAAIPWGHEPLWTRERAPGGHCAEALQARP